MSDDTLPRCRCGEPARYAADGRCETSFVEATIRWPGTDQSVCTFVTNHEGR